MMGPFQRYLRAKRSVDDRALNRNVYAALAGHPILQQRPLRVLEVGCGIGTMVERLIGWQLFAPASGVTYIAIDNDADSIAAARARVTPAEGMHLEFRHADLLDGAQVSAAGARAADTEAGEEPFDLLVAHAVLDLLHLPTALAELGRRLRPGGLAWFTINFDGATLFEPTLDDGLDAQIEALYHRTMDERMTNGLPSGDSRTGRHLFTHLPAAGFHILAAGASDWVVHPIIDAASPSPGISRYPEDEAFFLRFIVETAGGALASHPELDSGQLKRWVADRVAQIDAAQLTYIAHQLDFLAQRAGHPNHAPNYAPNHASWTVRPH